VWDTAALSQHPGTHDAPEGSCPALQAAWRQLVLETLVVVPGWRYSRYDPARTWSAVQAAAVHDANCQRVLALLTHRVRLTLKPHRSMHTSRRGFAALLGKPIPHRPQRRATSTSSSLTAGLEGTQGLEGQVPALFATQAQMERQLWSGARP
jgi:hypothetical protein